MLITKFRREGRRVMYTSCVMGPASPYSFYIPRWDTCILTPTGSPGLYFHVTFPSLANI